MIGNSGRFRGALSLMLGDVQAGVTSDSARDGVFMRFMSFADWLFAQTGKTHEIALERLVRLVQEFLTTQRHVEPALVAEVLQRDYEASGAKGRLAFLENVLAPAPRSASARRRLRQARHIMT
jgi:hypothetical protein